MKRQSVAMCYQLEILQTHATYGAVFSMEQDERYSLSCFHVEVNN